MFKPTSGKDRINYGEVLLPPAGYRLERAIGTTYSLDLEALMAVSMSLGLIEDTDSELQNNPISMLVALQRISDRIVVFCEAGQVKMPSKPNALFLTLEKMIVPVAIPFNRKIRRYPAFHPKTWLLEYSDKNGSKLYRFVVMSRNLTFDHSWDVACSMDGDTSSSGEVNAMPIMAFLEYLRKQLNKKLANYTRQSSLLSNMISTIKNVGFHVETGFLECDIMPIGIGPRSYDMSRDQLFISNFHDLVVMSPFLSGSVIENFNNPSKTLTDTTRTLITRRSELSKISGGKASNFDVYVMKDDIIDGESSISEGNEEHSEDESVKQDIHAKVYIRRKYGLTDLYLGSMNASYSAQNSNVELMLRLKAKNKVLNGKKFLDDIMGEDREGKKNPFELVSLKDVVNAEDVSLQDSVEQLIKKICRIKMSATVLPNDKKYDVCITTEMGSMVFDSVSIRPLRSQTEIALQPRMEFKSLEMIQLSEFYIISARIDNCKLERVIMIPTSNMPEGRGAEIINETIKKSNQFIEYVAFVLGDDYVQTYLENKKASGGVGEKDENKVMPAIYEKMLKTSVSDPDRLKEIKLVTKALEGKGIIPKEFSEMYSVFCETLGINQR